jgi:hypothetical protein
MLSPKQDTAHRRRRAFGLAGTCGPLPLPLFLIRPRHQRPFPNRSTRTTLFKYVYTIKVRGGVCGGVIPTPAAAAPTIPAGGASAPRSSNAAEAWFRSGLRPSLTPRFALRGPSGLGNCDRPGEGGGEAPLPGRVEESSMVRVQGQRILDGKSAGADTRSP